MRFLWVLHNTVKHCWHVCSRIRSWAWRCWVLRLRRRRPTSRGYTPASSRSWNTVKHYSKYNRSHHVLCIYSFIIKINIENVAQIWTSINWQSRLFWRRISHKTIPGRTLKNSSQPRRATCHEVTCQEVTCDTNTQLCQFSVSFKLYN